MFTMLIVAAISGLVLWPLLGFYNPRVWQGAACMAIGGSLIDYGATRDIDFVLGFGILLVCAFLVVPMLPHPESRLWCDCYDEEGVYFGPTIWPPS